MRRPLLGLRRRRRAAGSSPRARAGGAAYNRSGKSPGFGVLVIAETTTGCLLSASAEGEKGLLPEDLGRGVSEALCEEVAAGGCYDSASQVRSRARVVSRCVLVCARFVCWGMMNGALHFLLRRRSGDDDANHMRFLTPIGAAVGFCLMRFSLRAL